MKIRRSNERGTTELGWLQSRHTFSFGSYYDPLHMGYRSLRVINDDVVEPGGGFGQHGHRDMEIISIVTKGALEHRDSLGHRSVLRAGEVQVMTAGRGIEHSEFNPSEGTEVRFLQVWILPKVRGHEPSYNQRAFDRESRRNALLRIVAPAGDERGQELSINQDAHVFLLRVEPESTTRYDLKEGRGMWCQVIEGEIGLNGEVLTEGDGASVEGAAAVHLHSRGVAAEVILFDLP